MFWNANESNIEPKAGNETSFHDETCKAINEFVK